MLDVPAMLTPLATLRLRAPIFPCTDSDFVWSCVCWVGVELGGAWLDLGLPLGMGAGHGDEATTAMREDDNRQVPIVIETGTETGIEKTG